MIERTQSIAQHKRQNRWFCAGSKNRLHAFQSFVIKTSSKIFIFFCICGSYSRFKSQLSLQRRSLVTCSVSRWISNTEQAVKLEVEALHRSLRVTETDEKDSDNLPWRLLI